jgi:hypothetical protein
MTDQHFAPWSKVRVRLAHPPGHVRTPFYCRGHTGVVVECLGRHPNPERRAYRHPDADTLHLYRVRFRIADLWPGSPASHDEVDIELYENWLQSCGGRDGDA